MTFGFSPAQNDGPGDTVVFFLMEKDSAKTNIRRTRMNEARHTVFLFLTIILCAMLTACPPPGSSPNPPGPAHAGDLDTSFGGGGLAFAPVGTGAVEGAAAAMQSTGKIIGFFLVHGNLFDSIVMRFNTDGTLDTSFGDGGQRIFHSGVTTRIANGLMCMTVQPDDKIVLGGSYINTASKKIMFRLRRLTADGASDTGFGANGTVITDFPLAERSCCEKLMLQPNGKIIALGTMDHSILSREATIAARYDQDGTLDTGFNATGYAVITNGGDNACFIDAAPAPGGKIVILSSSSNDIFLSRLTSDGQMDTSFAGSGALDVDIAGYDCASFCVTVQNSGAVVVGGAVDDETDSFLVRFTPAGVLDTGFGTGGIRIINTAAEEIVWDCAVDGGDRVITVGRSGPAHEANAAIIARFTPDGGIDTSFNSTGFTTVTEGPLGNEFFGITLKGDAPLCVGGCTFLDDDRGAGSDLMAAAFTADGSADTFFGGDGTISRPIGDSIEITRDLIIQPDGHLLCLGQTLPLVLPACGVVMRFTPSGAPDFSFGGGDGKRVMMNPDRHYVSFTPQAGGGKTLLLDAKDTSGTLHVLRLNSDGSDDVSFGPGGEVTVTLPGTDVYGTVIASLPDGRFLIGGTVANGGGDDMFVACFSASGAPDPAFGSGGVTVLDRTPHDKCLDLEVLPDGSVLVGGSGGLMDDAIDSTVALLTPAGALDTGFGSGGFAVASMHVGEDRFTGIAYQPGGGVIAVGNSLSGDEYTGYAARFTPSGLLDTGWGVGGIIVIPNSQVNGVAVQADGMVLVPAVRTDDDLNYHWDLHRFTADSGAPDTAFGSGGSVRTDWGGSISIPVAVVIQADQYIVVGGYANPGSGLDMALARYIP